MINVTLDTNCIIALEKGEISAIDIRRLIKMHDSGKINLRLVGISASEQKSDKTFASNFREFETKIGALGIGHLEILKPLAYLGVSFLDWCILSGKEEEDLEQRIHGILFPNVAFSYADFCRHRNLDPNSPRTHPKWLNVKCDVQALWCHIHYRGRIFVTMDENFHKKTKKNALIDLGSGEILTPKSAVARLTADCSAT
jgi:hypothetical protein